MELVFFIDEKSFIDVMNSSIFITGMKKTWVTKACVHKEHFWDLTYGI